MPSPTVIVIIAVLIVCGIAAVLGDVVHALIWMFWIGLIAFAIYALAKWIQRKNSRQ